MSKETVVITVEDGIVQHVESKNNPVKYLIVDIDRKAEDEILSYLDTTEGNKEEVERCLAEHIERNKEADEA